MKVFCVLLLCLAASCAARIVNQQRWTYPNGQAAVGTMSQTGEGWKPCDPAVQQWSGYFNINATSNKNYFYWGFEARNFKATAPTILWLTGGPGCSGSLALFAENGPCKLHESTGEMYSNPYAWNTEANLIYVDQPAGVGYSYADFPSGYDTDEHQVAHDMFWFLQALFTAHPEWQKNDFFIFAESYGGHFGPATAHRVWEGNQKKEGLHIPLKGLGVGNGLVDPEIQYQYYGELAYNWCQTELGTPCVSESTYQSMQSAIPGCVSAIQGCMTNNSFDCDIARLECNGGEIEPYQFTGKNVYNIKAECTVPPLCYNFTAIHDFLNRADVMAALGAVSNTTWHSCNDGVNSMFSSDWFQRFDTMLPDLLGSNIRVAIYAGDLDFICNWIGNKHWTLALEWPMKSQFNNATDNSWTYDNVDIAKVRSVGNAETPILFSFLQIHGAGHMVPMDQPKSALAMVSKFLANKPFH